MMAKAALTMKNAMAQMTKTPDLVSWVSWSFAVVRSRGKVHSLDWRSGSGSVGVRRTADSVSAR